MDDRDRLADRFQELRPRLLAVAYRLLGSTSEADYHPRGLTRRPRRERHRATGASGSNGAAAHT